MQVFATDVAHARGTSTRPPSAVSSLGGFRTPAAGVRGSVYERPASENLHRCRHRKTAAVDTPIPDVTASGYPAPRWACSDSFKEHEMNQQGQWQVAGSAPEVYERELVLAVFGAWAPILVELATRPDG